MTPKEKAIAEGILKRLFEDSTFYMLGFGLAQDGDAIHVYFTTSEPKVDDLYLWLQSDWQVCPTMPTTVPIATKPVSEAEQEKRLIGLLRLRRQSVKNVALGETAPHLFITFESGEVLFANGHDGNFECWELGTTPHVDNWTLIACPGDHISWGYPKGTLLQ